MAKDNFSKQAKTYAQFRPSYPKEVYEYINSIIDNRNIALDCATGNGQMAIELAKIFDTVFATDISQKQIDNAFKAKNIHYSVGKAEETAFTDNIFDLITVAQAIHWFDFEKFYAEVRRIAQPNAILFIIGYNTPRFEGAIDNIIQDFYWNKIGAYWDSERKHIDNELNSIPFPFLALEAPTFKNEYFWNLETLEGYLNSWSAVQHFIQQNQENPVDILIERLKPIWKNKEKVSFPLFTKVGKIG